MKVLFVLICYHYIYAFSRRFYPKRLTFRLYSFSSVCVFPGNWTHNLLHCYRNALPLSHRNTDLDEIVNLVKLIFCQYISCTIFWINVIFYFIFKWCIYLAQNNWTELKCKIVLRLDVCFNQTPMLFAGKNTWKLKCFTDFREKSSREQNICYRRQQTRSRFMSVLRWQVNVYEYTSFHDIWFPSALFQTVMCHRRMTKGFIKVM